MTRDSARLGSIPPPPCGCNRVCLSGRVDGKPTPQRPHRRPYKRPRPPSPERLNVSARGAEAGTPRRESRRWRQGRARSSGEPPKEGRRRNSRQPKHEQERRGTAPEVRLLNDVAMALVAFLAARPLTDESRFSALPFQKPDRKSTRLNSRHLGISYAV